MLVIFLLVLSGLHACPLAPLGLWSGVLSCPTDLLFAYHQNVPARPAPRSLSKHVRSD